MQIGDKVLYKGVKYWVVSTPFGGIVEIAPTRHGAGGFEVLETRVELCEEKGNN